jgi:hypothetical protein
MRNKSEAVRWNEEDDEDSTIVQEFHYDKSADQVFEQVLPSTMIRVQRVNWFIQYLCWTLPQMIAGIVFGAVYFNSICNHVCIWLISYCCFSLFDPMPLFLYFFCKSKHTLWIARLFGTFGNTVRIILLIWGSYWTFRHDECQKGHLEAWIVAVVLLSIGYFATTCCFICNFVPLLLRDTRKRIGETLPLIPEDTATFKKYLI